MSDFEIPALHLPEFIVAKYTEPGTRYEDEPGEIVPAGWWVIGHDDPWEPTIQIHIGEVRDYNDNDISARVAKLLAAVLEEASAKGAELPGSEQPKPREPRVFPKGSPEPEGFDPKCDRCNYDRHACPGCGAPVNHGQRVCAECNAEHAADQLKSEVLADSEQADCDPM